MLGGIKALPGAIAKWDKASGWQVADCLKRLRQTQAAQERAEAIRELVSIVVRPTVVQGFGSYRQKRFLEVLALAGACGAVGINISSSDYDYAADIFPSAKNTAKGLRTIFPTAKTKPLQRAGIRCLSRVLSHRGANVPFRYTAAMLCFVRREADGVQSWLSQTSA